MSDKIVIHDDSDLKELNFQPIKITPIKGKILSEQRLHPKYPKRNAKTRRRWIL